MALLNEKFVSQGYPVVIGEFGAQDKTEKFADYNEFRRYWAEYLIKAAKKNGIVCVYWDNGYNGNKGFGIINRFDYTITQPDLIAGMMRAINSTDDYEIRHRQATQRSERVQRFISFSHTYMLIHLQGRTAFTRLICMMK